MRFNFSALPVLAAVLFAAAVPAHSQAAPSAIEGGLPLVVGAGFSDYNIDWGQGRREDGGTLWADWTIRQMPRRLNGLGIELEARDISVNPPAGLGFFRYDTVGGGAIYHVLRSRSINPYVKVLENFGSIDFLPGPGYSHDTRSFFAMGGGADFHAWRHIWVRTDYEYQMWYGLFGKQHALTPNGFTVGPEYDFGRRGSR